MRRLSSVPGSSPSSESRVALMAALMAAAAPNLACNNNGDDTKYLTITVATGSGGPDGLCPVLVDPGSDGELDITDEVLGQTCQPVAYAPLRVEAGDGHCESIQGIGDVCVVDNYKDVGYVYQIPLDSGVTGGVLAFARDGQELYTPIGYEFGKEYVDGERFYDSTNFADYKLEPGSYTLGIPIGHHFQSEGGSQPLLPEDQMGDLAANETVMPFSGPSEEIEGAQGLVTSVDKSLELPSE